MPDPIEYLRSLRSWIYSQRDAGVNAAVIDREVRTTSGGRYKSAADVMRRIDLVTRAQAENIAHAPELDPSRATPWEALGRHAREGLTFGLSAELADAIPGGETGADVTERLRLTREQYPKLSMAGEVGGAVLPGLIPGVALGRTLAAAPLAGRMLTGATLGAGEALAHGMGRAEGDVGERFREAATLPNLGVGAAVGAVLPPIAMGTAGGLEAALPGPLQIGSPAQRFVMRTVPEAEQLSAQAELDAMQQATRAVPGGSPIRVADTRAGRILTEQVGIADRPLAQSELAPALLGRSEMAPEGIERSLVDIIKQPQRLSVREMQAQAREAAQRARAIYQQLEAVTPQAMGADAREAAMEALDYVLESVPNADALMRYTRQLIGEDVWRATTPFVKVKGKWIVREASRPDFETLQGLKRAANDLGAAAKKKGYGGVAGRWWQMEDGLRERINSLWDRHPEASRAWREVVGLNDAPLQASKLWDTGRSADVRDLAFWYRAQQPSVQASFRRSALFELARRASESRNPLGVLEGALARGPKLRLVLSEDEVNQVRQLRDAYVAMRATSGALGGSPTAAREQMQRLGGTGVGEMFEPQTLFAFLRQRLLQDPAMLARQRLVGARATVPGLLSPTIPTDFFPAASRSLGSRLRHLDVPTTLTPAGVTALLQSRSQR